jgi:hypothetical protein
MSRELVKDIYQVTATFPQDERFGLTSQLRRASVSVSSNIAEENTREFLQETQLITLKAKIDQMRRMLNAIYKSTHKPINP